ncbi:MAG: lysozyme inhibitor LprI family protein [Alphaproteobacteria bacterium]
MRALVAVLVLLAAAAPAARADDDRDYLQACLAAAGGKTAAARTTCFGQVSEVCLSRSNGEPADMLDCAERELAAWQGLLDEALAGLRAREPEARVAAIETAQTAWRDWREARCAVYATYEGSVYPPLERLCLAETTSRRVVDLWEIATGFGEDRTDDRERTRDRDRTGDRERTGDGERTGDRDGNGGES